MVTNIRTKIDTTAYAGCPQSSKIVVPPLWMNTSFNLCLLAPFHIKSTVNLLHEDHLTQRHRIPQLRKVPGLVLAIVPRSPREQARAEINSCLRAISTRRQADSTQISCRT